MIHTMGRKRTSSSTTIRGMGKKLARHWRTVLMLTVLAARMPKLTLFTVNRRSETVDGYVTGKEKKYDDDGCSLIKEGMLPQPPQWDLYSRQDQQTFENVLQCLRSGFAGGYRTPVEYSFGESMEFHDAFFQNNYNSTLKKLQCTQQVTPSLTKSALQKFRQVRWIGDSVMLQQYYSLMCFADPNTLQTSANLKRATGIRTTDVIHYVLEHNTTTSTAALSTKNPTTTEFRVNRFGQQFPKSYMRNATLWENPVWTEFSSPRDLIIINAGLHYNLEDAHLLQQVAQFIASKSQETNATVVVMESHAQQFPTSNGFFSRDLCGQRPFCTCEPMTEPRLQGRASLAPHLLTRVDQTNQSEYQLPPILQSIYPNFQPPSNVTICVPDCAPSNWRNDLLRSVLLPNNRHAKNKVHMVPIWRQLVASGRDHSKVHGDCTHVKLEAALAMNQQLIRTLMQITQGWENNINDGDDLTTE